MHLWLFGVHVPSVFMCIVLYVKLMWCNGLACTYGQLTGGPPAFGISMHCPMCETYVVHLLWVYVHCAVYETYLV